jgi:thioredoxin reductase (NADPH)
MSHYLSREIEQTSNVSVRLRTEIVGGGGDAWLDHLVLTEQGSGREETVAAGGLFLMIGAHPRTEWLPSDIDRDDQGFILTGTDLPASRAWPLKRRPLLLETSMPAVFAAGDVRYGSG